MASYQDPKVGQDYLNFSRSPDGQIQHELIWQALQPFLPANAQTNILDAGCGDGWLLKKLSARYSSLFGLDVSEVLLDSAKANCPKARLQNWDIQRPLPFEKNFFDAVAAVMVLNNLPNLQAALRNLASALKPAGRLLLITPNPYYSYPVGVWKRGVLGRLFFKKPELKLRPYTNFNSKTAYRWQDKNIPTCFHSLEELINSALNAGFHLKHYGELTLAADSPRFDFTYIFHRFPKRLLLVFEKT